MSIETPVRPGSREENFVNYLIARIEQDKGLAARLRRADNPATEYQSWEFLAGFGIDLEQKHQRLPFVTIAAAVAKAKAKHNGTLKLGRAIAACYDDGNSSDQAGARLRRVLACDDLPELCRILRPVLALIDSRVGQSLNYVRLLKQLCHFGVAVHKGDDDWQRSIKAQWAQEFYGRQLGNPVGAAQAGAGEAA